MEAKKMMQVTYIRVQIRGEKMTVFAALCSFGHFRGIYKRLKFRKLLPITEV
jgi:hypothetical protein